MTRHPSQRRTIPLWQVVPLVLIPPAVVAAVSLYLDQRLTMFLYTCIGSAVVLMLMVSPRSRWRWALAGAIAVLALIFAASGASLIDWVAVVLPGAALSLHGGG
jgi:hypothetical protein